MGLTWRFNTKNDLIHPNYYLFFYLSICNIFGEMENVAVYGSTLDSCRIRPSVFPLQGAHRAAAACKDEGLYMYITWFSDKLVYDPQST